MDLSTQKFFAMSPSQKEQVHLYLAATALNQWQKSSSGGNVPSFYIESVCGTAQKVDLDLPFYALSCVLSKTEPKPVSEQYLEPICALQDDDWPLPDDAQFAYYAIYNTFQKYAMGKDVDDWLIVNQALSSLGEGSSEIVATFEAAINKVAELSVP